MDLTTFIRDLRDWERGIQQSAETRYKSRRNSLVSKSRRGSIVSASRRGSISLSPELQEPIETQGSNPIILPGGLANLTANLTSTEDPTQPNFTESLTGNEKSEENPPATSIAEMEHDAAPDDSQSIRQNLAYWTEAESLFASFKQKPFHSRRRSSYIFLSDELKQKSIEESSSYRYLQSLFFPPRLCSDATVISDKATKANHKAEDSNQNAVPSNRIPAQTHLNMLPKQLNTNRPRVVDVRDKRVLEAIKQPRPRTKVLTGNNLLTDIPPQLASLQTRDNHDGVCILHAHFTCSPEAPAPRRPSHRLRNRSAVEAREPARPPPCRRVGAQLDRRLPPAARRAARRPGRPSGPGERLASSRPARPDARASPRPGPCAAAGRVALVPPGRRPAGAAAAQPPSHGPRRPARDFPPIFSAAHADVDSPAGRRRPRARRRRGAAAVTGGRQPDLTLGRSGPKRGTGRVRRAVQRADAWHCPRLGPRPVTVG